MTKKKTAIIITGMHRSGTSSIAGVVSMLGAALPQSLLPPKSENPRGFFESDRIMQFNDKLLLDAGSSWTDWRAVNNEWGKNPHFDTYAAEASLILSEEFPSSNFIVLKDPRIAKVLPLWNNVLQNMDYQPCHIIPIRDPAEVAESLYTRNTLSKNLSKMIWLRHVLDAEGYSRDLPRVFVYWPDFLEDWEREARKIADRFGFVWPRLSDDVRSTVGEFLSLELHHHQEVRELGADDSPGNGNQYVRRAYAALEAFYEDPYCSGAMQAFDSVREDYAKTERIYGPFFADLDAADRRQKLEFQQTRERAAGLAARVGELEPLLSATVHERDAARHQTGQLSAQIVERDSTIDALAGELERTRVQAAEFAVRVGELVALLKAALEERDAARLENDSLGALLAGKDSAMSALSETLAQTETRAAEFAARAARLKTLMEETLIERDAARQRGAALEETIAELEARVSAAEERSSLAEAELERMANMSAARKIASLFKASPSPPAKNGLGQ